jgi:hypothetical protein
MTPLTWAVDSLLLPGHSCSGDQHLVRETADGTLVAVVDGLGHGEEAAAAALTAISVLERYAGDDLVSLVRYCHEHLRLTRGAVMSLAHFNDHDKTLSWIGVGNVGGILLGSNGTAHHRTLLLRAGVVGQQLPTLQLCTAPVSFGDMLILTTDGIQKSFTDVLAPDAPPKILAERILNLHSSGEDEALVLVARYNGA